MTQIASAPAVASRPVTSTDVWKTAALALILIDHLGEFLFPDQPWMRAIGRAGAPIFFFLIGYAATRAVPWFWLAAGALLTGLDLWRAGGDMNAVTLNILISFAALRWLRPGMEALARRSLWMLWAAAAALIALVPLADMVLEYGTTGPLIALTGLAHRLAVETGPDCGATAPWMHRRALGAVATLVYALNEIDDYGFAIDDAWIAMAAIIAVSGLLLIYSRGDLITQPPAAAAALLRFCGRRSLEIYIAQIIGLMALGLALGIAPAADGGDEA